MEVEISADRVLLRPLVAADADPLHAIWADERVRRFLWDGEVIPAARTRAIWRRGIATEASRCVLRYGFTLLGFDVVEAITDVANAASVRVLEKLGMSLRRRETVDGLDTVFYDLSRDDWRNAG